MSIYTKLTQADKREICRLTGTDKQTLRRLLRGDGFPKNGDQLIKFIKEYSANDNKL